jgi:sigma-B regulation protein RsbU (phosphoserine phosphatase)
MVENILFVDDEADLELLIMQRFRKEIKNGVYQLHFAVNGLEALNTLMKHPEISVVVTDINMPVMDGLELLQRINKMKNPLIKVIVVSAYGDMNNIRVAMNNGAFDFLTKPIDLNDFEKTIQKTIEIIKVIREGIESQEKLTDVNMELDAAKEIQQAILPKKFPPFPHLTSFDVYGKMEAALQVGGDFFDFFMIDDDNLGFVVGDVSGKGVPSSIFMAVTRTLIYSYGKVGYSVNECLELTNNILCAESVDSMFVTTFYGILNIHTGEITYTNAGHNYPYIIKSDGTVKVLDEGSSIILGAFENAKYTKNILKLEPNDSIFLYTDGVNESMDLSRNQLGDEALFNHLCHLKSMQNKNNPKIITDSVFSLVKQHAQGTDQSDDITVLTITYYGDKK